MTTRNYQIRLRHLLLGTLAVCGLVLWMSDAMAAGGGGGDHGGGGGHGGGSEAAGDENATGPFYYKLDPIFAPVVHKRKIAGYAELVVTLEVGTKDAEKLVHSRLLVLRDEFMRDLQFQADMRSDGERAIDLKRIKGRFKVLANRLLGAGTVSEVLIQSALDRGN